MYGFSLVNLYRLCTAFFLVSVGFAYAQMCSIESCEASTGLSCKKENDSIFSFTIETKNVLDHEAMSAHCSSLYNQGGGIKVHSSYYNCTLPDGRELINPQPLLYKSETIENKNLFCSIQLSPNDIYNDWLNCTDGKASPIVVLSPSQIQNLGGKPVQRLMCNNPKIDQLIYFDNWDDYAKGNNPHIYNPSDFEGGGDEGGGDEGGGDEGGGDEGGGNDNPIVPSPDIPSGGISGGISGGGSGGGSSSGSMEVTLEGDFLTSAQLADQLNQYYDRSKLDRDSKEQSDISDLNAMGNYFEGLSNSQQEYIPKHSLDVRDFEETYQFKLGDAVCPPPYVLSFVMFGRSITYQLKYDFICDFALIIGYLVLASAYMTSAYIYLGLRKV